MPKQGFLVEASELPPSDLRPTLPEARRLYVVRAINDVGIVNRALDNPLNDKFLGSGIHGSPGLWEAERAYCASIAGLVINNDLDAEELIAREDHARLSEMILCAEKGGLRLKARRIKKVARSVRLSSLERCLIDVEFRDVIEGRSHVVLREERKTLDQKGVLEAIKTAA